MPRTFFSVAVFVLALASISGAANGVASKPQIAKLLVGLPGSKLATGIAVSISIELTNYKSLHNLELIIVSKASKKSYPLNVIQFICSANEDNAPESCPSPKVSSVNSGNAVLQVKFFLRPSVYRFSGSVSLQLRASSKGTGRSVSVAVAENLADFVILEPAAPKITLSSFPSNNVFKAGDEVSTSLVFANADTIKYSKVEINVIDASSKDSYPLNVIEFVCSFNDNNAPDQCPALVPSKNGNGVLGLTFFLRPNVFAFSGKARLVVKTTWAASGSSVEDKFEHVLTTFSVGPAIAADVELPGDTGGLKKSYKIGDSVKTMLAFQRADLIQYDEVEVGLISKAKGSTYPSSVILFVCSPDISGNAEVRCPSLPAATGSDATSTVPLSFALRPNVFGFKGTVALYVRTSWNVAGGSRQQLYKELTTLSVS